MIAICVRLLCLGCLVTSVSGCVQQLSWASVSDRLLHLNSSDEDLSAEFRAARRQFGNRTESVMLSYAALQESQHNYAEALQTYRELAEAYPDCVAAHLGMARIEESTGRSTQAEDILAQLAGRRHELDSRSEQLQVLVEQARFFSRRENWSEAITALESACSIDETNQECRYELGLALVRSGDLHRGLGHLSFAVGAPAAHYNIAWILHEQSRDQEAVVWLQHALQQPDQQTAEKSAQLLSEIRAAHPAWAGMPRDTVIQQTAGEHDGPSSPIRAAVATDLDYSPVRTADFHPATGGR